MLQVRRLIHVGQLPLHIQNIFMKDNLDITEPLVLLVGSIDSEGIKSTLKASGRQYKIKRLESSPENWKSIVSYFDQYEIRCAVIKLSGTTYDFFVNPDYSGARDAILEYLAKVRHAIFVYEKLLLGYSFKDIPQEDANEKEPEFDVYNDFYYPTDEVRNEVNNLLSSKGLNILPYSNNAELTVMASAYITDSEDGLLFRIYAPTGRMWANETERLIHLFQDYLSRVEKLPVRFDQHRTDRGIVYEFFNATVNDNTAQIKEESLTTQFQDFSQLLDLSMTNPSRAEEILKLKHIEAREAVPILTRYAKEAKRLQIDLKQEREQKILSIRHRLESELLDSLPQHIMLETISQLVDSAIPPPSSVSSALIGNHTPLQLNATSGSTITVNLQPQYVQAVNSIIAQEIEGDVYLTDNDRRLIELIREYAPDREPELTSAVRELADNSAPKPGRLIAKQKLKAFLSQAGSIAREVGINLLQSYIEKQMGL